MADRGFSPLRAPLDLDTLSFLDILLPAVAAAGSRFPLAAHLPGLRSSALPPIARTVLHAAVGSPFNPQFIRFVVPDDFSNEPIN